MTKLSKLHLFLYCAVVYDCAIIKSSRIITLIDMRVKKKKEIERLVNCLVEYGCWNWL